MAGLWPCTICTLNNENSKTVCALCGTARKVIEPDSGSDEIEVLSGPLKKRKRPQSPKVTIPEANSRQSTKSPSLPSSPDLGFLIETPKLPPTAARKLSPDLASPLQTPKKPERKRKRTSPLSISQLGADSSSNESLVDFTTRIRKKAGLASNSNHVAEDVQHKQEVKKSSKIGEKALSPKQVERAIKKKLKKAEEKSSKTREKALSPKQVKRALKKIKKVEEKKDKVLKRKKQQEERARKRTKAAHQKAIHKVMTMYKAKNFMLHEIQIVFSPSVLEMNPEILLTLTNKSSDWCPGTSSKFHKHPFLYRVDDSIHERMVTWEKFHFDPTLGKENPFDKNRRSRNFPGAPELQTNPEVDPKPPAPRSYAVFYLKRDEVLNSALIDGILYESLMFTDVILLITDYRFSGLPRKPCPIQDKLWTIWLDSENRIRHKFVKTDKEAAEFIGRQTRTLAEEQFKPKSTVIGMAVAANVRGPERGVRRTLTDIWKTYLMQIDQVSEDKARRIVNTYPTFSSLWNAYEGLSVGDGEELLVDKLSNRHETVLSQRVYKWLYAAVTGNETI